MSITKFFSLKSNYDGLDLAVMMVRPEGEARVLVQLAHGMCEHKERYLPFMQYLADRGCICVMNDHRGHGASLRSKDDLGYFYDQGDEALVQDIHQITLWMRRRWPGLPLVLFGHSMGSLAVRIAADRWDGDIDGLIVCGSPGSNPAAGAGLMLIKLIETFKGERHRSRLMQGMTTGAFAKKFPDPNHPAAWLSANMENVARYENDPLCGYTFTLNGYRALLKLMQRAYRMQGTRGNTGLPVRFYSGGDDPCAPDAKGFENALQCMRKAGFRNVQGHMFPGMRHEILGETEREMVFERMWQEAIAPVANQK